MEIFPLPQKINEIFVSRMKSPCWQEAFKVGIFYDCWVRFSPKTPNSLLYDDASKLYYLCSGPKVVDREPKAFVTQKRQPLKCGYAHPHWKKIPRRESLSTDKKLPKSTMNFHFSHSEERVAFVCQKLNTHTTLHPMKPKWFVRRM